MKALALAAVVVLFILGGLFTWLYLKDEEWESV